MVEGSQDLGPQIVKLLENSVDLVVCNCCLFFCECFLNKDALSMGRDEFLTSCVSMPDIQTLQS